MILRLDSYWVVIYPNDPFRIYNIGNNQPVPEIFADIDDLLRDVGYRPATSVEVGVRRFVDWFCEYYRYKRWGPTVSSTRWIEDRG
jgi:hypothetical protein